MQQDKFSSSFMLAVLFSCVLARAVGVFLPSLFVGICRYFDMRISMKQLLIIWFSGSIRGAIAFALSLQIDPKLSPNSSLLVSSTLVVVLITTLVFGGLMSIFTKVIGLKEESPNPSNLDYSTLIAGTEPSVQPESQEEKGPIQEIWEHFDYKYMQPLFLKELIPHRDLLEIKAEEQYEGEETKDEEESLAGSNLFGDAQRPVSPASSTKKKKSIRKPDSYSKEIEMKSIIFN